MYILGISGYYHDSAAALLKDGKIVAAAQEERFTRVKNDARFPARSISYCLSEAKISLSEVEAVTFYEKPLIKFDRIIETHLSYAPRGVRTFAKAMPSWLKDKLFLRKVLRAELAKVSGLPESQVPQILFTEHHQSHAASAFYPSPYQEAAVICLDGVGEWASGSVWLGRERELLPMWEQRFPHSLGLLYSAFTYFTGFKVNSGEYKLMGLAPYGDPVYVKKIYDNLLDLKSDGTFRLNLDYFDFVVGLKMTNKKFEDLFDGPAREPESLITEREMNLACSIQKVTEEIVLRMANAVQHETKQENLCLAGGVALNCVANGRLYRDSKFKKIWIQPAAGDAGGSIGAAFATWHQYFNNPRLAEKSDSMSGAYLGPSYSTDEIRRTLIELGATFKECTLDEVIEKASQRLASEDVVGWFQGRMEFGPRALGNRSILGDSRSPKMQSIMNLKIKFRESFRPFAPAVLAEDVDKYFNFSGASPYMMFATHIRDDQKVIAEENEKSLKGIDRLKMQRSTMPAVTHVDYSARIQTVHSDTNPKFHKLLESFKNKTGCSVIVNTSFNVRGEPIVCTVKEAFECFMKTDIDFLVVDNFVLDKREQNKSAFKILNGGLLNAD